MEDLDWLRSLLGDQPKELTEAVTGDGTTRTFRVANGPMSAGTLEVAIDGVGKLSPSDYAATADEITFAGPPAANAHVTWRYGRQLWTDPELEHYLTAAGRDWPTAGEEETQLARVYKAGSLAVDSLLRGGATALNFGSGVEQFDLASVYDRLARFRAQLASEVGAEARRPHVVEPSEPVEPTVP